MIVDSSTPHSFYPVLGKFGNPSALGAEECRFKSCIPDHIIEYLISVSVAVARWFLAPDRPGSNPGWRAQDKLILILRGVIGSTCRSGR